MNFDDFFRTATGRLPYAYQTTFATAPHLPDLLEAPTGSGKTATAVLGWLWRRLHGTPAQRAEAGARLVFCLPMRTLVEQTEHAARDWATQLGLGDEHLGICTMLGGAIDDGWDEMPERASVIIGTQDQLLSRALLRGYAMSRYRWPIHFALLNNDCTWVMDEVQLMGVGSSTGAQLQAFREQLGTAGTVKTVWMTATLAEGRLRTVDTTRAFVRQPFAASEPALTRRLNARKGLRKASGAIVKKGALAPLAREIANAHVPGTLTLVVVNRVRRAQELFSLLDGKTEATALIHSRFRPSDRRRIQTAALAGQFNGVLVATQAIEAGVDISARTLFTELAPWPSMVQRFGRLNRAGEHEQADAYWIDLQIEDDDLCLPYEKAVLALARRRVAELIDVGPANLARVAQDPEHPALPVIRRKDLLELFDTEPDLSGQDIDISRYIRATDDADVQVAWRDLGSASPAENATDLQRDELCSVPIYELDKLTKDKPVWRFDGLQRMWAKVDRLVPGQSVVVDTAVGGYDAKLGLTCERSHVPTAVVVPGTPPDADAADLLTFGGEYVTLQLHAADTAEEMTHLLATLAQHTAAFVDAQLLVEAARWHDAGKAHPAFQQMLIDNLPEGDTRRDAGPWAKSDRIHSGRNPRRFFRHELASALAWMACDKPDLGAFIVAAHHGKVRISLRARPGEEPPPEAPNRRFAHGVHDDDVVPAVDLGAGVVVPEQHITLSCMELGVTANGPSWSDRMARLLETHGPFRLAYLEMLVRVADWRASRRRQVVTPTSPDSNLGGGA